MFKESSAAQLPQLMLRENKGPHLVGRVSVKGSSQTAGHAKGIRELKSHSIPRAEAICSREPYGFSIERSRHSETQQIGLCL
uniref:Uncharacterized protein n=1 Tax=Cannabis sativa TaxID=3483 RepID=A0A803PA41_CANSA